MASFDGCLTRTRGGRAPVINLERATFVDSYALVGIACVAVAATFEDCPPNVVPPRVLLLCDASTPIHDALTMC